MTARGSVKVDFKRVNVLIAFHSLKASSGHDNTITFKEWSATRTYILTLSNIPLEKTQFSSLQRSTGLKRVEIMEHNNFYMS